MPLMSATEHCYRGSSKWNIRRTFAADAPKMPAELELPEKAKPEIIEDN
jgi:hypothetical protein